MDAASAASLIRGAVTAAFPIWADLGAGRGTFSLALASLVGTDGRVYAVERDLAALEALTAAARAHPGGAPVIAVPGDFAQSLELPVLDGVMMANAMHFVRADQQFRVLERTVAMLRPGGRLLIVEYDGRPANRWVPFPIPLVRLGELVQQLGLPDPVVAGKRPSAYGGTMYAAYTTCRG
jgi:SAM-dependent methyltransferase